MLHTSEHEKGHSSRQYHGMFSADLNLKYHIKKGHEKFGNAHLHNFFKNKKRKQFQIVYTTFIQSYYLYTFKYEKLNL